jgi:catechol 2,3-dioxygenase-like lactoylglutathione lyase family enzyme
MVLVLHSSAPFAKWAWLNRGIGTMRSINNILETALYVDDLQRSLDFYQTTFGFETLLCDERMRALSVAQYQVLLLFKKGASLQETPVPGGVIPPHDSNGTQHLAFSIDESDVESWEQTFESLNITIESRVQAPRGGRSLYIRDPDGHLVELATPGIWPVY